MIRRASLTLSLALLLTSTAFAEDRALELDTLLAEYKAAETEFDAKEFPDDATDADRIALYKSHPRWSFLPKFLAIVENDPSDEAALAASQWIVQQGNQIGPEWTPIYVAETTAWRAIGEHQLSEEEISQLCLTIATRQQAPSREAFLREMAARKDLPGNAPAIAAVSLAEYLAQRFHGLEAGGFESWWAGPEDEYFGYLRTQLAPEWVEYSTNRDAQSFRREAIELFRQVLDQYADTPFTLTAPGFRDLKTIGDKARKSLHALEHLYIGAPAPDFDSLDLDGNPVRLADYRGKLVLLSFWFPTCGPCIAAIPKEKALLDKHGNQQFAIIGVCRTSEAAPALEVAAEHRMTWPSINDGKPGKVTDAYNIQGWPTFYLIDADGKIASKDVGANKLEETIERLISQSQQDK